MKKLGSILVLAALTLIVGCKMSPDDIKVVSHTSGMAVGVLWISYDNPTEEQKAQVMDTLTVFEGVIGEVGTNSYVSVVYPTIQVYVMTSQAIQSKDKPLVLAGSLAVISGVDLMFVAHPDWKADVDNVGGYVKAFVDGAGVSLALQDNDPQVVEAVKSYKTRTAIKR